MSFPVGVGAGLVNDRERAVDTPKRKPINWRLPAVLPAMHRESACEMLADPSKDVSTCVSFLLPTLFTEHCNKNIYCSS